MLFAKFAQTLSFSPEFWVFHPWEFFARPQKSLAVEIIFEHIAYKNFIWRLTDDSRLNLKVKKKEKIN